MKKFYLLFAFFLASLTTGLHAQITCDFDTIYTGPHCAPYVVVDTARNTSPFPIIERRWYLTGRDTFIIANGGLNSTFSYIANRCGGYCLRMWAMNSQGDTCSVTKCFTVSCIPFCTLSVSPQTIYCPQEPVVVSMLCDSFPCGEVIWGDGNVDTVCQPVFEHWYQGTGCFTGAVIPANYICPPADTIFFTVCVCTPIASGTVSNNYFSCPDPNNPVHFVSTSQCADWVTWSFGDGNYSNIDTVSHFYGYPGCYPITLTACNGTCCDTTIIDTICIGGPHITDYTASPLLMCACADTVHFSFGTIQASSLILLYGCNQGIVQVNPITPIGTPQNPTYFDFYWPYCLTDSCRPQIIVGDSSGCLAYYTFPAAYIDSADADFTSNTQGVCGSGTVCFNDNTHYTLPQSHSVQWLWSFGDGATDTIENPCHYYSTEGTYTITLRVVSNAGCVDSVSKQITIHGYPTADFGFVINDSCYYTVVCFHDSSSADAGGVITHWQWCFDDGIMCDTSGANVCHYFLSEGNHTVILTVADENGCTVQDSAVVPVNFTRTVQASFVYSGTNGLIQFTNTSTGSFTSLNWDFGDGTSSSLANPLHQFPSTSIYTVTLTVTEANGCVDDVTISVFSIITSIEDIVREVDVKVIPNPFSDFTNIQITGAEGEYSFRVFNLVGTEITNVKLKSSELFKLYRDKLASGLYLFEVKANNKLLKRGKIVLQ